MTLNLDLNPDPQLTQICNLLKHIIFLLESKIAKGTEKFSTFTLTQGDKLFHFDLLRDEGHRNIPATSLLRSPHEPARQLSIQNRGPATIRYSTNRERSSVDAHIRVQSGEVDNWNLGDGFPILTDINFAIESGTGAYADVEVTIML